MSEDTNKQEYRIENDDELKKDLNLDEEIENKKLHQKADDFIDQLLDDSISESDKRTSVDEMGSKTQVEVTNLSKMLKQPVKKLSENSSEGGKISSSLLDLKRQVESLDPAKFDLSSPSGFMASLGRFIPFIGNRITRYFEKFESSEAIIEKIVKSLQEGGEQLKRDNITLSQDKERMQVAMRRLKQTIALGQMLDQKLEYKLDRDITPESDKHSFVKNELLFPLRQRILDLQQTLAVNQQGILTTELIIRNNRELMRGVTRSTNVTISALQVAVACALALNNQEIVLKKVNAINDTTSKILSSNAERLKSQGVKVHKQASEAQLNIEDLEKAFQDIKTALHDISKYREEALPRLKDSIGRMDKLTSEAAKEVDNIEKRENVENKITIDLDEDDYDVVS